MDSENTLHAENSPAIEFADGFGVDDDRDIHLEDTENTTITAPNG